MSARYILENRYQDSGWERLPMENFHYCGDAVCRASKLSEDAICYGMVRVVDMVDKRIIISYGAGKAPDGTRRFT